MKKLRFFVFYLRYLLVSKTKHSIHSPFVFKLVSEVISVHQPYYDFEKIESVRSRMLLSRDILQVKDLGAGSRVNNSREKKVRSIAENALASPRHAQLLFRLVNFFKPSALLEMGTSLGVTSLYLAVAIKNAKLITLEGCPETAAIARKNFKLLKAENIELQVGDFDDLLKPALEKLNKVDFIFIDGNHRKEALLRYFSVCKKYIHNDSLVVVDDINWSDEMREAWKIIKNDQEVSITIDLFFMGLVFFRKEQVKEDFVVRF